MTWQPTNPAHADLWQSLLTRAGERPAHLRYLRAVEAIIVAGVDADDVSAKIADLAHEGVSARVAEALQDDVFWLVEAELGAPLSEGWRRSQYPMAYHARRVTDARAARERARSRQGLEPLLKLKSMED